MKRVLSLVLAIALVFCFAGCGEKEQEKKQGTLDIEYYAKAGQMPECNYTIGSDVETLKSELSAAAQNDEEVVYSITEGENNVLVENGAFSFYYKKAEQDKGIGCIVNYGKAYGIETGTVIVEVKEAIAGCEYSEEPLSEENAFFMFGVNDGTVIKCTADDNTVVFVFQENALCATAIYKGDNW